MVDIRTEKNIERLRQVAVLQDAENAFLHERLAALSAKIDALEKANQEELQQELKAVQQHLAKLQKIQFGASSEKRKKDTEKSPKTSPNGVEAARVPNPTSRCKPSILNSMRPTRSAPAAATLWVKWANAPRTAR